MPLPGVSDWSFEDIRQRDPIRAARLEAPKIAKAHIYDVRRAMEGALRGRRRSICFARETKKEGYAARVVIQCLLPVDVYDHFFNGRAGYRAHFWNSKASGTQFNAELLNAIRDVLRIHIPYSVRGIRLDRDWNPAGTVPIVRDFILASLDPKLAKCWICTVPLKDAKETKYWWTCEPFLQAPWGRKEGRFAPHRSPGEAWLDVKGGFLSAGVVRQVKGPEKRARQLHKDGWT